MSRRFDVQWAEVAVRDLEDLVEFLEREAPGTASAVLDRLEATAERLATLPSRGRLVPELARFELHAYRELIVRPWRLVYRLGKGRVLVVGVFDGRRDLETVLLGRLLRQG